MRYWIGVASREHVKTGEAGGFSQLCHGKAQPLRRMSVGDGIIYYSPTEEFKGKDSCQRFTAIGKIVGEDAYQFEMWPGFVPYRRDVQFHPATEIEIRPLIEQLSFIQDPKRWGYMFRFGHFEINEKDYSLISGLMLGSKSNQ